jgi:hypothetical protein
MSDDLVLAAGRIVQERWPGARVSAGPDLEGSDRSTVLRLAVAGAPVSSVVLKAHHEAEGGVREAAALEVCGAIDLIGVSTTPPVIVMGDLGQGSSVADALLGDDPALARDLVLAWTAAMTSLRAEPTLFEAALVSHAERLGVDVPVVDSMPGWLAIAADRLVAQLPAIGVTPGSPALEELRGLESAFVTAQRSLTPSDACPDNNLRTPDGLVLLDFEGAQVRHVAWDAAYLLVPWPTCWCSWQLPAELAEEGLAAYGADRHDVELAALGWSLISTGIFLSRALEADHGFPGGPTRRAMLQHRLLGAHAGLPALTDLAAEVRAALLREWGPVPLELAPAFR